MAFEGDVALCARVVFDDLVRFVDDLDIQGLRDLCALHSCRLLPDPNVPIAVGAMWDGDQMFVSMGLEAQGRADAVGHEMIHFLSDAPRWEPLNYQIRGVDYDRDVFIEALAREVGHLFRQAHALFRGRESVIATVITPRQMRSRLHRQVQRLRKQRNNLQERLAITKKTLESLDAQAAAFAASFAAKRYDVKPPDPLQASLCDALIVEINKQIAAIDARLERWS